LQIAHRLFATPNASGIYVNMASKLPHKKLQNRDKKC
jgi:hypothetical protein